MHPSRVSRAGPPAGSQGFAIPFDTAGWKLAFPGRPERVTRPGVAGPTAPHCEVVP